MKILRCLLNSLLDAWGFLPILYMYCIGDKNGNRVFRMELLARLRFAENVERCFKSIGYDYAFAQKVFCTELFLLLVFSGVSAFFLITLFALFPNIVRLLSHLALFAVAVDKTRVWRGGASDAQVLMLAAASVYTLAGLWRTFRQIKRTEELADIIIGAGKKRTSPLFFASSLLACTVVTLIFVSIRLVDFQCNGIGYVLAWYYFLVSQVYTFKYCVRCVYGFFFFRSYTTHIRRTSLLELFSLLFASCLAGILKPLNIVGAAVRNGLVLLGYDPGSNALLRILENNRSKLYYAVIFNTPYFAASVRSREVFWHGELKERMNRIQFSEPMLPLILVSCCALIECWHSVVDCFRIEDMLVLQFTIYYSVMELFYTFSVVEIIKPFFLALADGAEEGAEKPAM
ncbi:hypothetical protein PAPHI01_2164 [Pancytospora philotis]|nr:hypothetical protein PAPHI01_2164 [Pancytospora philotis]